MAERLQLGSDGTHDGDYQTFFKARINGAQTVGAEHHFSHIIPPTSGRASGAEQQAEDCSRQGCGLPDAPFHGCGRVEKE